MIIYRHLQTELGMSFAARAPGELLMKWKRPFTTVEEMNDEMLKRWNSVVKPDDTGYYLGDFSLAKRSVEYFAPLLNGEKYLITGNHDPCHPCHKKKAEAGREVFLKAGLKSLELEQTLEIAGESVLLSPMQWPKKILI
jgi:calcineurin-like phosphoesterase family protein